MKLYDTLWSKQNLVSTNILSKGDKVTISNGSITSEVVISDSSNANYDWYKESKRRELFDDLEEMYDLTEEEFMNMIKKYHPEKLI